MWSSPFINSLAFYFLVLTPSFATAKQRDHGILRRQSDNSILGQVPEGCRTTCGPIDVVLTGCGSSACVCTEPNNVALKICMDCLVDYGTGTPTYNGLRSNAQAVLSKFGSDCLNQGLRLQQLILNPTPAPGPPGAGAVTTIPSIATRSSTASTSGPGANDGNGGNEAAAFSISLVSSIALVAGAIVVFV